MNETIYITGHKNPDTDSICSAIAYAEFKNRTGNIPSVPVRLGEVNRETSFVLNYFGVQAPRFIETVKAQVCDLNIDIAVPLSPQISLKMAWSIMRKNNLKTLPVVDDDDKLLGIATLSNLTSCYMDIWDNAILSKSSTSLENIMETLSAECLYSASENPEFNGKIVVAAMQPKSAQAIIEEGDVVICGDRDDSQDIAIESRASLIVITGNHELNTQIIEKAKSSGCSVISTPYDSFTAARLITLSVPVSYVMTKENLVCFRTDDFVEDIKDIMLQTRYRSYPVLDGNGKVVGSISRFHLISANKKKVVLVDHNERSHSVNGIEDAEVLEIIDHHRIADIQTGLPIYFRNEPVGSTSTIIASIFFDNGIRPSKKTAGLLCAAIISDTLLFKSPTSTNTDRMNLKRLSEICNLDIDNFAKEMFKAGTSLQGRSADELFHQDLKVFTLANMKVGVAQVSTMDLESFDTLKNDMLILMDKESLYGGYDLLIMMLTDILKGGSQMLVAGQEKEIVAKAFKVKLIDNSVYVPGVLSRKKQVIPPLTNAINLER
jgi:manganese-dependent inorganic pyrophosphatase